MQKHTDTPEIVRVAWHNVATGFSGIAKIAYTDEPGMTRTEKLQRIVSTATYCTPDRYPNFTVTEI